MLSFVSTYSEKLSFVDPLQRIKVTAKTITCFILDISSSLNGNIPTSSHLLTDRSGQSSICISLLRKSTEVTLGRLFCFLLILPSSCLCMCVCW